MKRIVKIALATTIGIVFTIAGLLMVMVGLIF